MARDLWDQNATSWDRERVVGFYGEELGNRICVLPNLREGQTDRVIWYHTPNGIYTTKSGYSWLILKKVRYEPHRIFWRLIWKLNLPPKIRIFIWRLRHNLLPTNSKIKSINPDFNQSCPRCNAAVEALVHALRDCVKSREVLMHRGFNDHLFSDVWSTGIDWLEWVMKLLDGKEDSKLIWDSVVSFCRDFRIHNLNNCAMIPRAARQS